MRLTTSLFNTSFTFKSVKDVLAKANEHRSGDVQAGVAASDMRERVAAKALLSEVTLAELRQYPSVP